MTDDEGVDVGGAEAGGTTRWRGAVLHLPTSGSRPDGLVAEDKVRTLTLFRPGNYAHHPTAPVDIAPFHDVLQGLGTHVKSIQLTRNADGTVDVRRARLELASTREFMRLAGHQRYIAMFYEIDGHVEIAGKRYPVRRYHTALEIILSPDTLAAMRGGYTFQHLAWMERRLAAAQIDASTIKAEQNRFRNLMRRFKPVFGIARPGVKLSWNTRKDKIENNRIQSSAPLRDVLAHLADEKPYHGRFTQPNTRIIGEGGVFYGMSLPWFTIATDTIFSTIGDPAKPLNQDQLTAMRGRALKRAAKQIVKPTSSLNSSSNANHLDPIYATEKPKRITILAFDRGMITVVQQQNDVRTLGIDAPDTDAFAASNETCRRAGAEWLPICGRWATNFETTCAIVSELEAVNPGAPPGATAEHVDPLPPLPDEDPLRPNRHNPSLFYFDMEGGTAAVLRMPFGNWAIMPQDDEGLARRIDAACRAHAPEDFLLKKTGDEDWTLRFNPKAARGGKWLVRDHPPELIRRVVRMIQESRY